MLFLESDVMEIDMSTLGNRGLALITARFLNLVQGSKKENELK